MKAAWVISEWDSCFLENISFPDEKTRQQAQILNQRNIIEIVELFSGIRIKSNSNIGYFDFGSFSLLIKPKLKGLPLARLFSYLYELKDIKLYNYSQYDLDDLDFFDLLIHMLYIYSDGLTRRGISKGYIRREQESAVMRGRLQLGRVAANAGMITERLPCCYYQREENTFLNQALLAGLKLAYSMAQDASLKYNLSRVIHLLSESVADIELNSRVLLMANQRVNRLTEDYYPILEIIEILLQVKAPQFDEVGNALSLSGYFFDMNRFFEKLVSKLLKTLPPEYAVLDQYHLKALFSYESRYNPNKRKTPTPRPDFALTKKGRIVQLLDAKYRDLWEQNLPHDMLYQLSIYAISGVGNGIASILYPVLSDVPKLQVINIHNPAQGDTLAQVEMRPLNLMKIADILTENRAYMMGNYLEEVVFSIV